MDLSNLIGFPLTMAKTMIKKETIVEVTGEEMLNATLIVTNAKQQGEIVVLTCSWFILNLGG